MERPLVRAMKGEQRFFPRARGRQLHRLGEHCHSVPSCLASPSSGAPVNSLTPKHSWRIEASWVVPSQVFVFNPFNPPAPGNQNLLSPWTYLFWAFPIHRIIDDVAFHDWFLSLNVFAGHPHCSSCQYLFGPFHGRVIFHCRGLPRLISTFIHWGCRSILAVPTLGFSE